MLFPCAVTRDLDVYQRQVDAEDALDSAAERLSSLWMDTIRSHCYGIPSAFEDQISELLYEAAKDAIVNPIDNDPTDTDDTVYRVRRWG